jgi:ammonia channel protein AmtB
MIRILILLLLAAAVLWFGWLVLRDMSKGDIAMAAGTIVLVALGIGHHLGIFKTGKKDTQK